MVPADAPSGDSTIGLLSPSEMVLPAHLSDGLQGLIDSGGSSDTHNYHVNRMDSKSFADFAKRNGPAFGGGMTAAVRGGHVRSADLARGK
jgi:hypothetical protein